jgi:hypothetical protein
VTQGTPVFTTNKTDHHDITEILLKVALNTITLTPLPLQAFVKKRVVRIEITLLFSK